MPETAVRSAALSARVPYFEDEDDARRLAVLPGVVLIAVVEVHQPAEPRIARFAGHRHAAAGRMISGRWTVSRSWREPEMRGNPGAWLQDLQERFDGGGASEGHQRQPLERGAHLGKAGERALIRQCVAPEMNGAPVRTSREAARSRSPHAFRCRAGRRHRESRDPDTSFASSGAAASRSVAQSKRCGSSQGSSANCGT